MDAAQVLIGGKWREANFKTTFHAQNPATGQTLAQAFPVSEWADCEAAVLAAGEAAEKLRTMAPERIADFLEAYARNIEASADKIARTAHEETGLPIAPRLKDVELPRTVNQLRQAAAAAREGSWARATLDLERNIRSCFEPIGPVVVFGPNNFPFAFNGISGGDFAAAIAAGNPVIAKAHPLHPETSRLLAEEARKAVVETGLPAATVQMIYHLANEDGLKLVSHPGVGAVAFTGSRTAGLHLKRAAEDAGKPIYLEMSSINPVVLLPGALAERLAEIAQELIDSCLAGAGQFCTSPNLILMLENSSAEELLDRVAKVFQERSPQPLLSSFGLSQMHSGVQSLVKAGAALVTGGGVAQGAGYRHENTLLRATARQFLVTGEALQREVFGNATLAVVASAPEELQEIVGQLEGNLTGSIYSAKSRSDDALYADIAPGLSRKVGRLLNDKMPTGVAVSPAMNHGGPYPATSHPGFTAVGIPASMVRFAALRCYDGVWQERLPDILRDKIANPSTWRSIDGAWVKG
jgi:NADP-dependent aldehyde dehydrogenase